MFGELVLTQWLEGLRAVLTLDAWFAITVGTALGIVVGAIPGLGSGQAVVLVLPVTFYMKPLTALVFLCSIYVSVMFGGLLTAILLNTPGAEENLCTVFDGFPMTQRGQASEALGLGIGASVTGGLISYMFLLVAMDPIARFALKFGPTEMFLIAVMGLTIIAALRGESMSKGLLAGALGLLMGTVGIAPSGEWRATFGQVYLADGIPFAAALIGLFAMAELFFLVEREFVAPASRVGRRSFRRILAGMGWVYRYPGTVIRSSLIGILIGAIPAAGATIAAATSYNEAKRFSRTPEKFGTGFPPGIVAAETANNASTGGALMTTLVLGVPGSATTALILGAMIMHGLQPGPQMIREQTALVYGLTMALFLSQIVMVAMATVAGYLLTNLLVVPTRILVPLVALFCMVGSFAVRNTIFDVFLMLVFGLVGWLMRKTGFPAVAMVLGIVLGPIADAELIRSAMRYGPEFYIQFFRRPISLALVVVITLGLVGPYLYGRYAGANRRPKFSAEGGLD